MNEPTADEIMKMFAVDIAVLRRGRRKPSEKPPVGKKKAKASKKPVKLTAEQLARKREHTRQWRMAHREQVLECNRRYKLAHRPTFHHFSREEQAAYETQLLPASTREEKTESGRLFETLIQYRLQGWVQPVY